MPDRILSYYRFSSGSSSIVHFHYTCLLTTHSPTYCRISPAIHISQIININIFLDKKKLSLQTPEQGSICIHRYIDVTELLIMIEYPNYFHLPSVNSEWL